MAQYPDYFPITDSSDFPAILTTSQQMYSDLLAQGNGCCKSKSTLEVLCQADVFFQDIDITGNISSDTYNLDRWKEDIKDVYTILSSFFRLSADVSPVTPVVFPVEALADLERGKQYLSNLNAQYIEDLHKGCDCMPLSFECLKRLLRALDFKNALDEYDDISIELIRKMIIIIGDYALETPPTVDAGANQTVELGGTAIFTAVGTAGSSPIVSYLWTQESGTPATLTNANTPVLTVTDFSAGNSVFKVTVTDENALTGSDSVQLTGEEASLVAYWWLSDMGDAPLNQAQILATNSFNFADQGTLTIPFTGLTYKRVNMAYPVAQPTKNHYVNANDSGDNGSIGSITDLMGAVITTGIFKQHNGSYVINGNRTLIFSTQ